MLEDNPFLAVIVSFILTALLGWFIIEERRKEIELGESNDWRRIDYKKDKNNNGNTYSCWKLKAEARKK
jgi:hypothetical protein